MIEAPYPYLEVSYLNIWGQPRWAIEHYYPLQESLEL